MCLFRCNSLKQKDTIFLKSIAQFDRNWSPSLPVALKVTLALNFSSVWFESTPTRWRRLVRSAAHVLAPKLSWSERFCQSTCLDTPCSFRRNRKSWRRCRRIRGKRPGDRRTQNGRSVRSRKGRLTVFMGRFVHCLCVSVALFIDARKRFLKLSHVCC